MNIKKSIVVLLAAWVVGMAISIPLIAVVLPHIPPAWKTTAELLSGGICTIIVMIVLYAIFAEWLSD